MNGVPCRNQSSKIKGTYNVVLNGVGGLALLRLGLYLEWLLT
ncbi:MAG: hypothetical protein CM1200mP28_01220 [Deltaproteobacteria bacterium]|nr:MAG: hypothetical protein CM1200mP28_01220 [Deltaproteobacteria bacterium]